MQWLLKDSRLLAEDFSGWTSHTYRQKHTHTHTHTHTSTVVLPHSADGGSVLWTASVTFRSASEFCLLQIHDVTGGVKQRQQCTGKTPNLTSKLQY